MSDIKTTRTALDIVERLEGIEWVLNTLLERRGKMDSYLDNCYLDLDNAIAFIATHLGITKELSAHREKLRAKEDNNEKT